MLLALSLSLSLLLSSSLSLFPQGSRVGPNHPRKATPLIVGGDSARARDIEGARRRREREREKIKFYAPRHARTPVDVEAKRRAPVCLQAASQLPRKRKLMTAARLRAEVAGKGKGEFVFCRPTAVAGGPRVC